MPAPVNTDLFKVIELHCGVCIEPLHLIESYIVLGVTGYLGIRYGAGLLKGLLWTLSFSLILFGLGRETESKKGSV